MKILKIAYYTILRNFRDRQTLINMILSPIFIIFIMANILNGQVNSEDKNKIKVGFLNQDRGDISSQFEEYINSDEIKNYIEIIDVKSKNEGIEQIKNKKISSLIILENGYTEGIKQGTGAKINVYNQDRSSYKASVVKGIVDSYINESNSTLAILAVKDDKTSILKYNNIDDTSIPSEKSTPSFLEYYAVTMLIMSIMYGSGYGASEMQEDLFYSTGLRIRSTPVKTIELFTGKTLGSIFTVFLQGIIIILVTKQFYGASWGNNIALVFLIIFLMSILSVGFGIAIALLSKDEYMANRILNVITPVFTLISGGYFKLNFGSKIIEGIRFFIPNQLAHIAIFNTVYNGSIKLIMLSIITMICMIFINFVIAAFAIRRCRD